MAVGAYPATHADVTNPQVRRGTADEKIASKCDDNETVSKRLMARVESRNLVDAVRNAGSWDAISQHSDVWKGDDGSRQWKLMEVAINLNAKTKSAKSTGS